MPAVLSAATAQLTFIIFILGGAAVVTLVLGAVGLYGVLAYVVTLRSASWASASHSAPHRARWPRR